MDIQQERQSGTTAGTKLNRFQQKIIEKLKEEITKEEIEKKKQGFFSKMFSSNKSPLEKKLKINNAKQKKGFVSVILIRDNGSIDIKKLKIENDMLYLNDNKAYHMANADYIMRFKKYPVIIIPEWSVEPLSPTYFSPVEDAKLSRKEGRGLEAQKFSIKAAEMSMLDKKKSGGNARWLIIIVIGVIILYVIYTYLIK